jgi:hypothetical protein
MFCCLHAIKALLYARFEYVIHGGKHSPHELYALLALKLVFIQSVMAWSKLNCRAVTSLDSYSLIAFSAHGHVIIGGDIAERKNVHHSIRIVPHRIQVITKVALIVQLYPSSITSHHGWTINLVNITE